MHIANSESPVVQRVEPLHQLSRSEKTVAEPASVQASGSRSGDSVSISGKALLMARVFFSEKLGYEPKIITEVNARTQAGSCAFFLNKEDRQVLGEMYEFAREQGADLRYVDSLAFSLGYYRQNDNGKIMRPISSVGYGDGDGHKLTFSFTDKDTATINRILSSEALKTSRLDRGFIRYETSADYGVFHNNDFEFMEQMINKFSTKGESSSSLDARFSEFKELKENHIEHVSKEKYWNLKKKTGSALDKSKASKVNGQPTAPETLRQALRRIVTDYLRYCFGRISSLADFLMRSGH